MLPPHIQEEIERAAIVEQELQGGWPETVELRQWRQTVWYELPYYFLPAFPSLRPEDIFPVALFTRLIANSIIIHDHVADRDAPMQDVAKTTLRIMAMQFEAYRLLHPIFPPGSPFWERLRSYLSEYAESSLVEISFALGQRPWTEYTEELALRIATHKFGLSRSIIAGLTELAGDDRLLTPLLDALNHYNTACQLWDDLNDWKDDLLHGMPSLLLARAFPERPRRLDAARLRGETEQLTRKVYYDGHAGYTLRLALRSLNTAAQIKELVPDLPWLRLIESVRQKYQSLLDDIDRIIQRNVERARRQPRLTLELPQARDRWQQAAWAGVRFLLRQWQLGFGEARDLAQYWDDPDHRSVGTCQYGDIFQRALCMDALCDAGELLGGHLRPVLDHEANYLLGRRLTSGVGGWAYFNDMPALPPDADVLAQVMQALLRAKRRADVEAHCETPLDVLLRDGALPDGSYKTWIVPATNRTQEQQWHAEYAQQCDGSHEEVVANLLYALKLYDPVRFDDVIRRGVAYLEGRQHADGTWSSMFYYGHHYSSYICLRVLGIATPDSPAVRPALDMVRGGQRADGGWGVDGEPTDALSTALSLLALAVAPIHSADARDRERVTRALDYLESVHGDDGSWPDRKLINIGGNTYHGSRTVTTLFVVKAALAWHRRLQEQPVDDAPAASPDAAVADCEQSA